jgi:hypothetical protein
MEQILFQVIDFSLFLSLVLFSQIHFFHFSPLFTSIPFNLKLITPRQMLRLLHLFNKLLLFNTPLTLPSPIQQNTLELLHPQLGQILLLQILRLYGEFHGAYLGITLIDLLAETIGSHPQRKGLGRIEFDRVDVVADFLFAGGEGGFVDTVGSDGGFDSEIEIDDKEWRVMYENEKLVRGEVASDRLCCTIFT